MSHAHQGGQAPDQANSGHQAGAAARTQTNHSEGTHNAAGPLTSHMRHDHNQAGDGPSQTDPTSLTVPRLTGIGRRGREEIELSEVARRRARPRISHSQPKPRQFGNDVLHLWPAPVLRMTPERARFGSIYLGRGYRGVGSWRAGNRPAGGHLGRSAVPVPGTARQRAGVEHTNPSTPGRASRLRRVAFRLRLWGRQISRKRDQQVGCVSESGWRLGANVLRNGRVDGLGRRVDAARRCEAPTPLDARFSSRSHGDRAVSRNPDAHGI